MNNNNDNNFSVYDILANEYNANESEIESFFKFFPSLNETWHKDNIKTKLDILLYFGFSITEIAENPSVLNQKTHALFNKFKVAHIMQFEPTIKWLSSYVHFNGINANTNAVLQGELPVDHNLLSHPENSARALNMSFDSFMGAFYVEHKTDEFLNLYLSKYYPDFYSELISTFPYLFSELKNQTKKYTKGEKTSTTQRTQVDSSKKTLREKIKELYSTPTTHRARKVKLLSTSEEDICYTTDKDAWRRKRDMLIQNQYGDEEEFLDEESEVVEAIANSQEDSIETIQPSPSNENVNVQIEETPTEIDYTILENHQESENESEETKRTNGYSEQFPLTDEEAKELIEEFATTYNVSKELIIERQALCKKLFNMTREEYFKKLELSSDILTCSQNDIDVAVMQIYAILGLNDEQKNSYVKTSTRFPFSNINLHSKKLNMMRSYGFTNDELALNFNFLNTRIDRLELRVKLAYILKASKSDFIKGGFKIIEQAMYARYMGLKNGIIKNVNPYLLSINFYKATGTSSYNLLQLFPWDDELSPKIINNEYEQSKSLVHPWRLSSQTSIKQETIQPVVVESERVPVETIQETPMMVESQPTSVRDQYIEQKPTLEGKIVTLESYGFTFDEIMDNVDILGTKLDRIESRIKLAIIANVPKAEFISGLYKISEDRTYARIMAKRKGLIAEDIDLLSSNGYFLEKTGYNTADLIKRFPFSQPAHDRIDEEVKSIDASALGYVLPEQTSSQENNTPVSTQEKISAIEINFTEIASIYGISEEDVIVRQKFLNETFGLTEEEFSKLTTYYNTYNKGLLRWSEQNLINFANEICDEFQLTKEEFHDFLVTYSYFPNLKLNYVKEKVELLEKYGISLEDLRNNKNYNILTKKPEEIELRIKLAIINGLDKANFLIYSHSKNAAIIYSRLKAKLVENINIDNIYCSTRELIKTTGTSSQDLISKYPLTTDSLEEIEQWYADALAQGLCWIKKQESSTELNIENATEETNSKPSGHKKIYPKFSSLPEEQQQFIQNFYQFTDSEMQRALEKTPSIATLKEETLSKIKEFLLLNYGITSDDFTSACRIYPALAIKTEDEFVSYFNFYTDKFTLAKSEAKQLLLEFPSLISKDKELIYERCVALAEVFDVKFFDVVEAIINQPSCLCIKKDTLVKNAKKALEIGMDKKVILGNLSCLKASAESMKIKYMLNKLSGYTDEDFASRNYLTSARKIYARIMFNQRFGVYANIHISEGFYLKAIQKLIEEFKEIPAYLGDIEDGKTTSEKLMEMFPLTEDAMLEIQRNYNSKFKDRQLQLSKEELEYGNE